MPQFLNTLGTEYNLSPLQPWTLQHRLFRDTAKPAATSVGSSIDEQPRSSGPRYLQFLTLSHHPATCYVAISSAIAPAPTRAGPPVSSTLSGESSGEPATIISIPSASQSDEFVQLLIAKFGPLWTQRQTLSVKNGQTFEVGEYTVRAGEVVQGYGAGNGGAALGRGVVVEIEWTGEDGTGDGGGEGLVQAFWDTLGVKGARECVNVAGMAEGFTSVRQWIEVLRIRN